MPFDIATLEQLANDPQFVAQVRRLVRALIAADPQQAKRLLPLRAYGPEQPGSLLRLDPRLRLDIANLPSGDMAELFDVQHRLMTAAV